ncbi:MAG: GGDEF domain-containing protein [Desulfotomaculales bacterium]
MWPVKSSFDVSDIIAEAAILAAAAYFLAFVWAVALRRERRALVLLTVGGALYFLGALCGLLDEFFRVPDLLKRCVENLLLAAGAVAIIGGVRLLLPYLLAEATTDPLTGLLNRRGVERALRRELARARRHGLPLAVLFGDLDGLKDINDAHGHRAGDAALRLVAGCLRANLRETDAAGRWGGDEFLVVLPHTDAAGAEAVMRRLKASCAALSAVLDFPVEVSCGAACCPEDGTQVEELLAAADRRMYQAKRRGEGGPVPVQRPLP